MKFLQLCPYSEKLAYRIREALTAVKKVKEKEMMGGLTFMVNDKLKRNLTIG